MLLDLLDWNNGLVLLEWPSAVRNYVLETIGMKNSFIYLNFKQKIIKKLKKIKSTQNKKLFNLGLQHEVTRLNPEQLIFNYSNRKLSDDEIELLRHGLRYALPPKKIEYSRWFLPFEKLLFKLKNIPIYDSTQDGFNFVRSSLKNTAFKYFCSFKRH